MATTNVTSKTWTLDANDTYVIRHGQLEKRPYTLILHMVDSSDDGSYAVSARPQGSAAATAFVPIPYQSLYLNGSVGTGALVDDAITGSSMIAVEADGMEVALVRTGGSTGSTALTVGFASLAS